MPNPTDKTAETVALTRNSGHYELYSSRATIGLICRPVKRIPKPDNNSVSAARAQGAASAAAAAPTPQEGAKDGAQSAEPDKPLNPISREQQKANDDAIQRVLGGFRARLLLDKEITDLAEKNSNSEDEYGPLIKMPLPEKIKDSLRVNYSTADMGFAAAGYLFGEDIAKPFATGPGVTDALVGNASYVIRTLLSGLAPSIGAIAQKSSGNIPNPFTAAIFEKVTPRKFNFSWTIQPQTAEESKNLRNIINQFRYWSLPNPSRSGLILDVPYEWELSFVGTNFLYAFSRCVMSNLDIDYSPNGFNAFMIDGAPQSVTITMDFEEIYPLDKANLDSKGVPESMKIEIGMGTDRPQDNALENAKKQEDLDKQLAAANAAKKREENSDDELAKAKGRFEAAINTPIGDPDPNNPNFNMNAFYRAKYAREYNSAIDSLGTARTQTDLEETKLSQYDQAVPVRERTPLPSKVSTNIKDYETTP
jgi:hypothetical protein